MIAIVIGGWLPQIGGSASGLVYLGLPILGQCRPGKSGIKMTASRSHTVDGMECCLAEALSVLNGTATAMGAGNVAVVVADSSASIRIVYEWPASGVHTKGGRAGSLSQVEQFLKERLSPASRSFVVVPWPVERARVAIAFGFASSEPGPLAIPDAATLRLAALAIWISFEAQRLRRDLIVVSERLGQRKTVERAKGLLQAQHGWSEPQAYEHLRKLSRQRRKPMAEIAQAVLRARQGTG